MKSLPDHIKVFKAVGAEEPHIGEEEETMSWGNAEGAVYIKNTPANIIEAYVNFMWDQEQKAKATRSLHPVRN